MPPSFLFDGPRDASLTVALAHGAGAPMDHPFMARIAEGIAGAGFRVARFEFPYMAERRRTGKKRPPDREPVLRAAFSDVAEALGADRLVLAGKSMGGRIASLVADEIGVRGLICLGYPFHPPGKPDRLRTAHLAALRTPALILQGERDPFGTRTEVESYALSPRISIRFLPDGEHSLKPRKPSGRTEADNLAEAVAQAVSFLGELNT